jgi:hypothetical protein
VRMICGGHITGGAVAGKNTAESGMVGLLTCCDLTDC